MEKDTSVPAFLLISPSHHYDTVMEFTTTSSTTYTHMNTTSSPASLTSSMSVTYELPCESPLTSLINSSNEHVSPSNSSSLVHMNNVASHTFIVSSDEDHVRPTYEQSSVKPDARSERTSDCNQNEMSLKSDFIHENTSLKSGFNSEKISLKSNFNHEATSLKSDYNPGEASLNFRTCSSLPSYINSVHPAHLYRVVPSYSYHQSTPDHSGQPSAVASLTSPPKAASADDKPRDFVTVVAVGGWSSGEIKHMK